MEQNLKHFKKSEFRGWAMSPLLLAMLDELRDTTGVSISISPVDGAIGRHAGEDSKSSHNVDVQPYNEVRAVDIFPRIKGKPLTTHQAQEFFKAAKNLGFTGIGVYPFWKPVPGFHLDVRRGKDAGDPATWGDIGKGGQHVYTDLHSAMKKWSEDIQWDTFN